MPAVMSRFGGVALRRVARAGPWNPAKDEREMQKMPYDESKEGVIRAPDYVGWDSTIDNDFKKLTTGPNKSLKPYRYEKICESALDLIGYTPMVRMARLSNFLDVDCDFVAKVELFNAGGSVKDRIAKRMVEEAEKTLGQCDILIEATSGNTGVGLCMVSAIKGYKQIICLPQKMSGEKVNTMKCLGAEILRTPTEAAWDAEDSHIFLSARLAKDLGGHVLDQYKNAGNPLAHYDGTAEEIAEQCEGKLDYMIMSTGTGGTMTGVAKKLKERALQSAEPAEVNEKSTRTGQEKLSAYQVEGIGYDFIPTVLDREIVDYWVKTDDDEAFAMCRKFMDDGWMQEVFGLCSSLSQERRRHFLSSFQDFLEDKYRDLFLLATSRCRRGSPQSVLYPPGAFGITRPLQAPSCSARCGPWPVAVGAHEELASELWRSSAMGSSPHLTELVRRRPCGQRDSGQRIAPGKLARIQASEITPFFYPEEAAACSITLVTDPATSPTGQIMTIARDGEGALERVFLDNQLPAAGAFLNDVAQARFAKGNKLDIMEPILVVHRDGLRGIAVRPDEARRLVTLGIHPADARAMGNKAVASQQYWAAAEFYCAGLQHAEMDIIATLLSNRCQARRTGHAVEHFLRADSYEKEETLHRSLEENAKFVGVATIVLMVLLACACIFLKSILLQGP
eukprot:g267.t1